MITNHGLHNPDNNNILITQRRDIVTYTNHDLVAVM